MSVIQPLAPVLLVIGAALLFLPRLDRHGHVARFVLSAICAALLVRYTHWRLTETLPSVTSPVELAWSYSFLVLELGSVLGCLLSLLFLARHVTRSEEADKHAAWVNATTPPVDIFIPTYNEDAGVLEPAIVGAINQNYPNFRVFVLDDGRREWLEALCARHKVGYLTREGNAHAKAGNINAALKHLRADGSLGEYVAIFDADFVALPDFLRRTLALFHDETVGVVQTPQHFFNPDPIQHSLRAAGVVPDEQRFFFDTLLPAKDAWGVAFSCGTSSLTRVRALESIGGIPVDSITEDMLLSQKLKASGWKTVYLNERLSMGLAPEGLSEYITQRSRWCIGFMQIFKGEFGLFGRKASLIDRLLMLDTFLFWGASFPFRLFCLLAPIAYWFLGLAVFHTDLASLLIYLGPALAAQLIFVTWVANGRFIPIVSDAAQLLFARDAVKAAVSGLFRNKGHKFEVTAKGGDRSKTTVQWRLLGQFGVLIGLTLAGIVYHALYPHAHGGDGTVIVLFWSYFNIIVMWIACFVCIEPPRPLGAVFRMSETCYLGHDGPLRRCDLKSLGTRSAEVTGQGGVARGDAVLLHVEDLPPMRGTVEEHHGDDAVLVLEEQSPDLMRKLVGKLFSGQYNALPRPRGLIEVTGPLYQRFAS